VKEKYFIEKANDRAEENVLHHQPSKYWDQIGIYWEGRRKA
jgi:hypothetical protein